ncbi:phage tail domain-containing protein [Lactiplantibacillus paraxiangfangensis]|uniref:phage tail domain-containing protein n=1 Tax=Lactiplantibacillus paraxiangfangensis TaxID=3076224 RepID=UPI0030C6F25D
MDLLVERIDGRRYLLSQYKVLITDFEESAPNVTRNQTQLEYRNGSIDFGAWHDSKSISVTGYYRADDMDEEETIRNRLFSLFSDVRGYYITQFKTDSMPSFERPGENDGDYYDQLENYPSNKRFFVYTQAPKVELEGNINGTLLYKLSVDFSTVKLPYGESIARDVPVPSGVVPYSGTVPCSQLEQGFIFQFTTTQAGTNLSIKLNGTEFTYTGAVANGDVFKLGGFSYLRNGVSVVNATNKAYFVLQPEVQNKVTTSLTGNIKILNFQNLFA